MALYKISDFDPNYRDQFDDQDILKFDLYSGNDKVGSIDDLLVDESGRFRYFIINTGAWIFGKKVMLPIGRSRIDYNARRVFVDGLTKDQVESLPEFTGEKEVDYDYEEQVRSTYRPMAGDRDLNLAGSAPVESNTPITPGATAPTPYDRNTYRYDEHDSSLFGLNDRDHQNLRLYEERLIANKHRQKTGEVAVGKRVETERAQVAVPLEKERVVIERVDAADTGRPVAPGEAAFQQGEVARVEVYEETPEIHKEAFVREEIGIRKEVERETRTAEDEIRRERLDVRTDGNPVVDKRPNPLPDERR